MDIATRVQRGITLLDAHTPDWRVQIDRTSLDMGSSQTGVLEQLYGSFRVGRDALGLTWNHDETGCFENGFDIDDTEYGNTDRENIGKWVRLTTAWKRALNAKE